MKTRSAHGRRRRPQSVPVCISDRMCSVIAPPADAHPICIDRSLDPDLWPRPENHKDRFVGSWTVAVEDAISAGKDYFGAKPGELIGVRGWHREPSAVAVINGQLEVAIKRLLGPDGPSVALIKMPKGSGLLVAIRNSQSRSSALNCLFGTPCEQILLEIDEYLCKYPFLEQKTGDRPIWLRRVGRVWELVSDESNPDAVVCQEEVRNALFSKLPTDFSAREQRLIDLNAGFRAELAHAYTDIIRARFKGRTDDATYAVKQKVRDEFVNQLARFDMAIRHPARPSEGPCMLTLIADSSEGHYALESRTTGRRKGYFKSIADLFRTSESSFALEPDLPRQERRRWTSRISAPSDSKQK
jgi:hypothetical protein